MSVSPCNHCPHIKYGRGSMVIIETCTHPNLPRPRSIRVRDCASIHRPGYITTPTWCPLEQDGPDWRPEP